MTWLQLGVLALVFLFVAGGAAGLMMLTAPDLARQRLEVVAGESRFESQLLIEDSTDSTFKRLLHRLSSIATPGEGEEQLKSRQQFLNAGMRSATAPVTYYGIKAFLTLGLPMVGYVLLTFGGSSPTVNSTLLTCVVLALLGNYGPSIVLRQLIAKRQLEIFENFPDALDLMTVCVEAGLGTEAAMTRVAEDLHTKSPVLAEEMRLVNLELRAGADRERAMRNLALRTGLEEVNTFVSMIIQAERFGTSVATSLRIQSEQLRTKRRQLAEEKASKMALKMLIPLIFCIFPALMVVLMGPAMINLAKTFGSMGGQ